MAPRPCRGGIALASLAGVPALSPRHIEPMYATVGKDVPTGSGWAFEPKYDGVRVLAFATTTSAKLMTRNGKDKAAQFPEVVAALRAMVVRRRGRPLVLDGEVVAMGEAGEPARFQQLQSRMHLKDERELERQLEQTPAALIVFDVLVDGDETLTAQPWSTRRRRLERLLGGGGSRNGKRRGPIRLGDSVIGDGDAMLAQARRAGWEGIIAKRVGAPYVPGARSRDWLKLKVEFRQEFVIGGFTEPRNTRPHLGALLLGYFEGDRFIYVGHTGGGFTRQGLEEMRQRLDALERPTPPFDTPPRTNEPAHWVTPRVVVEVKFSEWTAEGRLRQPIYLGTRDDKNARDVGREATSMQRKAGRGTERGTGAGTGASRGSSSRRTPIATQLSRIEADGGDGTLVFPNGVTLSVTSLDKPFFEQPKLTKGDLMRYYARVAPALLPLLKDRPLSLKRFPNGASGMSFFQQNAGEHVPDGVRVADVETEDGRVEPRFIGGDLPTLLHTVQLGTIAVNHWHSRLKSLDRPDYAVLDLDPSPRVPFSRIVQVARTVREELAARRLRGVAKTSGSRGIHIVFPLPRRADYAAAARLAEEVAAAVVDADPKIATIERSLKARPAGSVYVDHMQNARGKTLASAFSARAKPDATVSTPIAWSQVTPDLDPHAFTIETVPSRLARARTLWEKGLKGK